MWHRICAQREKFFSFLGRSSPMDGPACSAIYLPVCPHANKHRCTRAVRSSCRHECIRTKHSFKNNNLQDKSNLVTGLGDISEPCNCVTSSDRGCCELLFRRESTPAMHSIPVKSACGQAWVEKKGNLALIHCLESFFQFVPNYETAAAWCQPQAWTMAKSLKNI